MRWDRRIGITARRQSGVSVSRWLLAREGRVGTPVPGWTCGAWHAAVYHTVRRGWRWVHSCLLDKFVFATEKKPVRCQPPTPPIQVLYMYTGSPYSNRTESVPGGVKSYGNLEDTPLFALFDCSFQNFFRLRIPCLHV